MRELRDIVIVSAVRTPMGKFGGTLKDMKTYDIAAFPIREALKRAKVEGDDLDDAIIGSCRQAGNHVNPAKTAAARGGAGKGVPGVTINKACPAGMKAVSLATQLIQVEQAKRGLVRRHGEHVDDPPPAQGPPLGGLPHGPGDHRGRLERRPRPGGRHVHGDDRREPGGQVRADPRRARPVRRREPPEGRAGPEGGLVRRADHPGHRAGQPQAARVRLRQRTNRSATTPIWRPWPNSSRRSRRTARSPPATPAA